MKLVKILLLFSLTYFIVVSNVKAQSITGKVSDAQTGQPLNHVHISVLGTALGTMSYANGDFTIEKLNDGHYTLRVSLIGFETVDQPVVVDSSMYINIALTPAVIQLNKLVIVTAQRHETRQFDIPEAISVLNQKQLLQNAPRSTPEALMGLPGVWVQKTNHGGGSPFIRGLTGQQTLILIDGIRLNNATFRSGPNQYFNTIDPQSIAQIEVLRGSGSVQYGSDALGGVVHVLTKNPEFSANGSRFSGSMYTKYMSANMEKSGRAEMEFSSTNVAILGGVALRDFGDILAGGNMGKQKPTGYEQLSGDIKLKARAGSKYLFTGAYQVLNQDKVPVFHKVQLEDFAYNYFDPQKRQLGYAQAEAFYNHPLFKHIKLTAALAQSVEGRIGQKNNSAVITKERDQVNTKAITFTVNSAPSAKWSVESGVEYYSDKVFSSREDVNTEKNENISKRGLYPDGSTASTIALFSLHTYTFNKFTFSAGGRFNAISIAVNENILGKSTIEPKALAGNFSALYALHPKHHLTASINTGFRAPNIDDMGTLGIVDFRYEIPNTNLQPEKSLNMEVGIKSKTERFSSSLALYRTNLTNIISRIRSSTDSIQGYPVYLKENVAEAYIQGIEAEAEIQLIPNLAAYGSLIYTYGHNKTANEPFRRIPPLNGRLGMYYQYKKAWTKLEWLYAAKQSRLAKGDIDDNRIAKGGTPAWSILNLNAGYQIKWLLISAEFHNIFNEAYRTHGSGIDGYGRSYWISTKIQF
jgi:iron complex outermembrane receptor protein/hemoglobin/transferrin/lactoferrin receptor protein